MQTTNLHQIQDYIIKDTPTNDERYIPVASPKAPRLFTAPNMDGVTHSSEPVVVIVPSGNYNEPRELGRYKNIQIAFQIVKALALHEYRMFSLESGEELSFRADSVQYH